MIAGPAVLEGLRVVEAAAYVAAPLGGLTLAQLGADVIRIDPPTGGLDFRRWPVSADGTSLFWCGLNRNKRSVVIDLSCDAGRELATALVCAPGRDAGFLVTNFPARGWLGHDALAKRRPDLVQVTLQGDRHGGSAVDYTVNPRLGMPALTGPAGEGEPVNHVLPAWDLIAGQMIALALLSAERQRSRTGRGQHVQIALEDVGLAMVAHLGFVAEAELGQSRPRIGNDLFGAFGRDFATCDGERVMVVALTAKQWGGLCEATGLGGALSAIALDHGLDFSREGDRYLGRERIAACLAPWFLSRTLDQVRAAFEANAVCWGRYQSTRQLVEEDPSCSTVNPLFSRVNQPGVGDLLAPASPMRFAHGSSPRPRAAPQLGAHTEEVLSELLGIGQSEYGRLREQGVVGRRAQAA